MQCNNAQQNQTASVCVCVCVCVCVHVTDPYVLVQRLALMPMVLLTNYFIQLH